VNVLKFEDIDMETAWKIKVEDFLAFISLDHEGEDFYSNLAT